ncbi:MAG: VOC family protein [Actinomycetota bacterium]
MDLGAFSISLAVSDLTASLDFYGALGFEQVGGDGENWAVLNNGTASIGLFQGMFDRNILTFNPGWSGPPPDNEPEAFTDIREIRSVVGSAGLDVRDDTTAESAAGPASFVLVDPDGNPVLIDQHR